MDVRIQPGIPPRVHRGWRGLVLGLACATVGSCVDGRPLEVRYLGRAEACVPYMEWPADETSLEETSVEVLNLRRGLGTSCGDASGNRPALESSPELRCAARMLARDMAERGRVSALDGAGNDAAARAELAGAEQLVLGELRARAFDSVDAALDAWGEAPETCALLDDPSAVSVGVGTFSISAQDPLYWVMILGRP